jgi:hypothetical protein
VGAERALASGTGVSGDSGVARPDQVPWVIRALVNCGEAGEVEDGLWLGDEGLLRYAVASPNPDTGLSLPTLGASSESSSVGLDEAFLMTRGEGEARPLLGHRWRSEKRAMDLGAPIRVAGVARGGSPSPLARDLRQGTGP